MGVINDFLNGIKKKYPNTQAVREQIEELRDTLNLKCEEYIKQGLPEEEAEAAAVASIGDVGALFNEVSGNVRTVYISHLRRNTAAFMFHMILFEIFGLWVLLRYVMTDYYFYINDMMGITFDTYLPYILVVLGMGVWLLVAYLIWKRDPKKAATVVFEYKKMMIRSALGWLVISAVAVLICFISSERYDTYYMSVNILIQSIILPVAGALNLPLGVFVYYRKFKGGFYDA